MKTMQANNNQGKGGSTVANTGGSKAFVYGGCTAGERQELAKVFGTLEFAPEHFGTGDLSIDWDVPKVSVAMVGFVPVMFVRFVRDAIAPARRNQLAAAMCDALVVCGRPKFTTAIVRSFRHRGRRIFWLSGGALQEVEPKVNKSGFRVDARMEPEIWDEQREEKFRAIRDFLDACPWAQRKPDAIPTYGWVEAATDTGANRRKDVCEWTKWYDRKRAEKDWARRCREAGC